MEGLGLGYGAAHSGGGRRGRGGRSDGGRHMQGRHGSVGIGSDEQRPGAGTEQ